MTQRWDKKKTMRGEKGEEFLRTRVDTFYLAYTKQKYK